MTEGISVRILDRDFMIGCPADEREALQAAAQMLEGRMREIRSDHRMAAFDRVAVIAALNLAAEVNALQRERNGRDSELARGIAELNRKIEALLIAHAAR